MIESTKELKRVLGKRELFGIAVGQIIGAGLISLMPSAIGMTGKGVNVAFLISAILVSLNAIPMLFVASSLRLRGGQYSQGIILVGNTYGGFWIIIYIIRNISIAMYCLSFADYLNELIPGIPLKTVAIAVATFTFLINYFGIKNASIVQLIMVICLAIGLASFTVFGIFKVNPQYFNDPNYFSNGIKGLLSASGLLLFATGGATAIIDIGAECKNPTKDIPFVIIVSTFAVAIFYAIMSIVASGILPISEVANKPLTLVAQRILPTPLYVFFIIGGCMFALLTTLNATVAWLTKPIMQACDDGWFPYQIAKLSRFKTPTYLLGFFYLITILPIIFDFSIANIASFTICIQFVQQTINSISVLRLPKLFPDNWKKSPFYMPENIFRILVIFGTLAGLISIAFSLLSFNISMIVGNVVVLIISILFAIIRMKSGKVDIKISFEDQ